MPTSGRSILHLAAAAGKQIDILINNSGTARNQYLGAVTADEFERQYNINVRGPLLLVPGGAGVFAEGSERKDREHR